MKSTAKAASGGVVVVAALIALMFMRGPGTGSGKTDGEGLSPVNKSMATTESMPETSNASSMQSPEAVVKETADGGLTPDEEKALSGTVLGILIDEHQYLLEVPGEAESIYRPTELPKLIALAKQAEGDSNGIRVRILQRESARAQAEQDLRDALATAGISANAIYMPDAFIP
jgi:hypothetical protein